MRVLTTTVMFSLSHRMARLSTHEFESEFEQKQKPRGHEESEMSCCVLCAGTLQTPFATHIHNSLAHHAISFTRPSAYFKHHVGVYIMLCNTTRASLRAMFERRSMDTFSNHSMQIIYLCWCCVKSCVKIWVGDFAPKTLL